MTRYSHTFFSHKNGLMCFCGATVPQDKGMHADLYLLNVSINAAMLLTLI